MARETSPAGRRSTSNGRSGNLAPSRLGTVIRFTRGAKLAGIKKLEKSGLRVASSSDFRAAASVPNDLGGADIQYFERFGIAIARPRSEALGPTLRKVMAENIATDTRPERLYRALGAPSARSAPAVAVADLVEAGSPDYLRGYRDGVNGILDRLLREDSGRSEVARARADESAATYGLQITRVLGSTLSGKGIKIAVLDTGFDELHPDFVGRKVVKKTFASRSSDADMVGHGTHCIGTACGLRHPTKGPRYGVAYEAEIYAGKVLGDDGFGTDRSIIAGMEWALDQGCDIISMSLGGATELGEEPIDDYERIGDICLDSGALVVAAAGNESERPGHIAPVGTPANASTIMAVGGIDHALRMYKASCGGMNPNQDVDIAAPGVRVLSSLPNGEYDRFNGTSMATPHVAGIAALIAQSNKKYRGRALWARLLQLAKPLSLPARDVGRGLVQAPPK